MQELSKNQIIQILNHKVITDSRQAGSSKVFLALKGENFDGHDYVKQAIDNGCNLAIVEKQIADVPITSQIIVDSTIKAYGQIANYHRQQFKGTLIGLTGSSGKTTTKEELKYMLANFGKVYATSENLNNFIGVPKSLLEIDLSADFAVIEMGMSAMGEISYLTSIVEPDVALVTNVYPMHLEFFESFEQIAYAKAEIFESLNKQKTAVINQDSYFSNILQEQAQKHTTNIIIYGQDKHYEGELILNEDGEIQRYNAWACLAVAQALNLDMQKAALSLKDFGLVAGRGKKHKLKLPQGGSFTLIDDSYSGQPDAMKIAIKNLSNMEQQGRKIAMLGKMAELGEASQQAHMEIGTLVSGSNIDVVIGVCPEMKDMLAQLPSSIEQHYCANKDEAESLLNNFLQNNDILLIKGARYSSKLYQLAQKLIEME